MEECRHGASGASLLLLLAPLHTAAAWRWLAAALRWRRWPCCGCVSLQVELRDSKLAGVFGYVPQQMFDFDPEW